MDFTLYDVDGTSVLFSVSAKHTLAHFKALLQLRRASNTLSPALLETLTIQVLRTCPASKIKSFLTLLASAGEGSKALSSIPNANAVSVCGVVFRAGDVVWTCRQCAKDQTCVQCDGCFKGSNHDGHEVYFHRANGSGGCCDCGDKEAWAKEGNCHEHNCQCEQEVDPLTCLPSAIASDMDVLLRAGMGVLTSFLVGLVRGYAPWAQNPYIAHGGGVGRRADDADAANSSLLTVTLHNDDVHTYTDVEGALLGVGKSLADAKRMTESVDKEGHKCVFTAAPTSVLLKTHSDKLGTEAGLMVSICPHELLELEARMSEFLTWMLDLGTGNDGFRRIITNAFLLNTDSLPEEATAVLNCVGLTPPNHVFDDTSIFPSIVQHLKTLPPCIPEQSIEALRFQRPIPSTCPPNILGVMMLSSPYLFKSIKQGLNSIVIVFQQDPIFKSAFSQLLTLLYPSIHGLFCRGIGTAADELFISTVQVYTANGVVTTMSSEGIATRLFSEAPHPIFITQMLIYCIKTALCDVGCKGSQERRRMTGIASDRRPSPVQQQQEKWLMHHLIINRRLGRLFRDIEYVTENCFGSMNLMLGERDAGAIGEWLSVCSLLQCVGTLVRRTTTHVEVEDDTWQHAANLILELEGISASFISNALFPSKELMAAEMQFSSAKIGEELIAQHDSGGREASAASTSQALIYSPSLRKLQAEAVVIALRRGLEELRDWIAGAASAVDGSSEGEMVDPGLYFGTAEHSYLMGSCVHVIGPQRYQVSVSPVSIHIPLHRFIAKIFLFAANNNLPLTDALISLKEHLNIVDVLADYPSRCFAFVSQVLAGMWRRNGAAAINIGYNYQYGALSVRLRDMDLLALQASMMAIGPDSILALLLDRFELIPLLETLAPRLHLADAFGSLPRLAKGCSTMKFFLDEKNIKPVLKEYGAALLSELLKVLINLVTFIPSSLVAASYSEVIGDAQQHTPSLVHAVEREIVHAVLGGVAKNIRQLGIVKNFIGGDKCVSDELINQVVSSICINRGDVGVGGGGGGGGGGGAQGLDLKPEFFDLFDPEYAHLTQQQQHAAFEKASGQRSRKVAAAAAGGGGSTKKVVAPCIDKKAIPTPHPSLQPVVSLLFRPLFLTLLERSLRLCLDNAKDLGGGGAVTSVCERVVHVVTLAIHMSNPSNTPTPTASLDTLEALWGNDGVKESSSISRNLPVEQVDLDTLNVVCWHLSPTHAAVSVGSFEDEIVAACEAEAASEGEKVPLIVAGYRWRFATKISEARIKAVFGGEIDNSKREIGFGFAPLCFSNTETNIGYAFPLLVALVDCYLGTNLVSVNTQVEQERTKSRLQFQQEAPPVHECARCHIAGEQVQFRCSACKRTYYCSADCQRSHWSAHKEQCRHLAAAPALVASSDAANTGGATATSSTSSAVSFAAAKTEYTRRHTPMQVEDDQETFTSTSTSAMDTSQSLATSSGGSSGSSNNKATTVTSCPNSSPLASTSIASGGGGGDGAGGGGGGKI